MRTRFLATDYAAAGVSQAETLDFVNLHLPDFPPPNYPSFSEYFELSFDYIPVLSISHEVEKLPIDDALSMFLSDVLPHFVDCAGLEEPRISSSKDKSEVISLEEKNGTTTSGKGGNGHKFVQFEIPEMDISLLPSESAVHYQIECLDIFSEIPDAELTMDLCNSDLAVQDHLEVQQSIYSVEDISVECLTEQKADILEDPDSLEGKLHSNNIRFPLFEVDVEILGVLERRYTMDDLLSHKNIEKQQLPQPDEVICNKKELLGSLEFDLIKCLLDPCVETPCLEDTKFSSPVDLISIIELSHCHESSKDDHGTPYDDSMWSTNQILFDEILFFDIDPYNFVEIISDSAKEVEAETCESMFGEAMHFRNFSELIVCHELTLKDDTFKSLPAPIFSDHSNTSSLHTLVDELLTQLDWQSSSASDGLYLDWHFLGGDGCESAKYSSCWKMLGEIDTYEIDVSLNSSDSGKLIFDFILSEGYSKKQNAENCKEILNLSNSDVSVFNSSARADLSSLNNHGDGIRTNDEASQKTCAEKVSIFGESMTSDLEFFLNSRNYVIQKESILADKLVDTNTVSEVLTSADDFSAANATTGVQQKWNVKMHQVKLSDNILIVIDYMWENFSTMLENNKELIGMKNQYQASNDLMLSHLPNETLKLRLQEKIDSDTYSAHNDDDIMVLAMLCAIKQMAFYLCYYGIQATYLYMDKLCTSLQCMKSRLSFLYDLIRDENQKSEKELSLIHPSISVVKEILQMKLSNSNSKFLIVSDQVFWWPLKRLLASLKISYNDPQHLFLPPYEQNHCCEFTDTIMDIMLNSDCCLVSHEYITTSFPFSKFSFILEYGGPDGTSRISSICPKSDRLPTLYFLKVELDESSIAKALSHGVDMPKRVKDEMKKDLGSGSAHNGSKTKLEELLNTIPIKETYGNEPQAVNEDEKCTPAQPKPVGLESKQLLSCKSLFPNIVIIVNTQNLNEVMVISRRSTYQKILEMEKEGAQVVERDIGLSVDLIISSAVCVTWYNCRNIWKKASAPDEAFSCLPLCVESIAASILTSLSFAFSCCILIFEGESNFLCSIMESSDEIYAAGASLGIDVQVFLSYSSEMTEEIILSCINVAAQLKGGLYPKMPDSESLAESFLTAFPSINPLSAHAILSSDFILGKFLELPNGDRLGALQKYQVPEESIALLSAISRYGEREDSRSGMTDCSSSLSVPDSENSQLKSASERKKPKYTHKPYKAGEPPNDLFHTKPLKFLPDDQLNLPEVSASNNSWLSGNAGAAHELEQFSLSFNDKLFSPSQDIHDDMMKKPIAKSSPYDFSLSKDLHISDERDKSWMPLINIDCSPRRKSATMAKNSFGIQSINLSGNLHENFAGEIIDLDDTEDFRENFSLPNSSSFSPIFHDIEKDNALRNSSRSTRPPTAPNLPMFQNPIDIDACGPWVSRNDERERAKPHFDTIRRNISMTSNEGILEDNIVEKAPQNSFKLSFQEKGIQKFGGTPLSNALHSTQAQQGSPWTIEFLNRIREKSRLRRQSVSSDLPSPCLRSLGNTPKVTKRKSPSILDFYMYKGGSSSTPQKTVQQKRLKRSPQSSNSLKNNKASASLPPSRTPIDKRARRKLSFSTNGSGGQSKLIWRDIGSHTMQRRL